MPCQVIPVLYNDVFYYREKVKVVSRPLDIKLYNTLSPTLSKGGVDSNVVDSGIGFKSQIQDSLSSDLGPSQKPLSRSCCLQARPTKICPVLLQKLKSRD